ncbi:protein IQ-DOMAIN 1-like [Ipomoea triloba]|uniref:protein IQ-DOMAIN 1-like n=1 Tax=Ipomoea triloba TaxID=35885 RepID=UPI00125CF1D1|nr:protein IQ-DOMAIN 1-like [Ipomoea triloba]
MGKKGSWLSSVKKAFSPDSKKASKSNKKRLEKEQLQVPDSSIFETPIVSLPAPPVPPVEEVKPTEVEKEQTKHAYSVAVATVAAAEAAVAAAHAAAEVVRLTAPNRFAGKSKEEIAAIRIQTAFRGYLARRALRALRGLVRLKSLVDGPTVKRQTANTLKCMQTLSRVQSQIHSRRNRMLEENRALQRQLVQKHAKELENLRRGEEWDDSIQSKEQVEANLLSKYEAATRRERALAYSYSHQQTWKKSSRSPNLLFMDPTNPQWGWSWLERWMGARPWETEGMSEKELRNDQLSVKGASISVGEITKSFARHQLNAEQPSSPASQKPSHSLGRHSPATPASKQQSPSLISARKLKSPSPRANAATTQDDDTRSVFSVQSERNRRRHSIAGSSVRDDESLASSPSTVPSYMAPTHSAKAKTRLQSPSDGENGTTTPERGTAGAAKKRLSYPRSPASRPRRHSGPPKVENISIAQPGTNGEIN